MASAEEGQERRDSLSSETRVTADERTKQRKAHDETYLDDEKIIIPDYALEKTFSWRALWLFTGPGWLMSIAYLDPGNIESDMQSGALAEFSLLWVLFWATVIGFFMQRLAVRLGVVSGRHLAQACYEGYKPVPRILLWLMVEVAIIGSDMQEVIGTAIAIYLLSNKAVPIWAGVLITILDTFTFLFLDRYGLRKLEAFFAFLVAVMGFSFAYQYFYDIPDQVGVIKGTVIPWCFDCGKDEWMQAVAAVGAVIMPHNLYLHSALVKSRDIDRNDPKKVRTANKYYMIEGAIALFVSFLISMTVIAVFGEQYYGQTYGSANATCQGTKFEDEFFYEDPTEDLPVDLYNAGIFLGCTFSIACTYIWGVGILASGQASTMTGTYAGQFAMEGFLNIRWQRWKRVLVTRTIAMIPTFSLAVYSDIDDMTNMNDVLNGIMSVQLPFAVIPVLTFTSNRFLMGKFVNGLGMKIFSTIIAVVIILINIGFVGASLTALESSWWLWTLVGIGAVLYFAFIAYLSVYLFICLGWESLVDQPWVQKYYWVEDWVEDRQLQAKVQEKLQHEKQ